MLSYTRSMLSMRRHHARATSNCHRQHRTTNSHRFSEQGLYYALCRQCSLLMVLCFVFAVAHVEGEDIMNRNRPQLGSEADAVTIADLNGKIERLSGKIEGLTNRMENILAAAEAAADSQDGSVPQEDSLVPDASLEGEKHTNSQHSKRKNVGPPPQVEGEARGKGRSDEKRGSSRSTGYGEGFAWTWLAVGTFVHEVWLCLQHANILLNPFCQRLDRRYGVALMESTCCLDFSAALMGSISLLLQGALLKRRMYWVIAGVLAAYWAREVLSMWMASPYVSSLTWKMIVVSSLYHVGKISLISLDARRGWSPTMGIMRLLIDHWHLSSVKDLLLSTKRVVLQAFDTATHALIVRDMLSWDERFEGRELGLQNILLVVGAVWALHAIANLLTRKSTATLVVEVAKGVVAGWGASGGKRRRKLSDGAQGGIGVFGALDGGSAEFVCTSSCSHRHKNCEVCHLLTRDQPAGLPPPAVPPRRKRVD